MENIITLENYEEKRRELVEKNSNLTGIILRKEEEKVDRYLSSLKEEYHKNFGEENYDIPVLKNKEIIKSRLYDFCSKLPKGGDLHVHDMALLPLKELVKLLCDCPEFCINSDRKSYDLKVSSGEIPEGYIRFCDAVKEGYYSYDDLLENWTVEGAEKSGKGIWEYFEDLFSRQEALSCNVEFAEKYYNYAFRYYCRLNIMHIEIHIMLTDDTAEESFEYVKAMQRAYYSAKEEYPYFTVKIIGAGVKADSENIEFTKKCFYNASYVQETVKDKTPFGEKNFLIGFDLVNEEDSSLPLEKFAPMLIKVRKQFPNMKFFIHSGESINAGNDNLIDAYLLGASRVGHGLNLYRFPDLHSRFVKSEICLEVCPISNQRLGYTKDMRNHPVTEYLRSGMAISLCSDDPAYMENETLTDDYFSAVVSFDIGLSDLKQLGLNSIMYSGLDDDEKLASLKAYNELWNEFIQLMLKDEI